MNKKMLFPQIGSLIHGGDYNPEQWLDRPDILAQDIQMMKKAGMNSASVGIFSWSMLEPREGEFHFEWLKEIVENLYQNGIYTVLATPTGARPAWLDAKYPEVLRVGKNGVRNMHGLRHNHCMSSLAYREKVRIMNTKLAETFQDHKGVVLWHISNELGGECYCPLCQERFRQWLRERYDNDIEKLNHAWWTTFWSHRFNDFDQIEAPMLQGESTIHGLNLDWKRFNSWNMTDYLKFEVDILKAITPKLPVTTNFMKLYEPFDYHEMAKEIDIVSWDTYPRYHNDYETLYDTAAENAMDHAVIRCLKKDQPFMLMESVPSLVNWHAFNKLKRPGMHWLSSFQAIACGSDTVQYFQWRKSRGSFEQYHGAVVDHLGTDDTRVFRDVADTGEKLQKISEVAGTVIKAETAMLFDWDNRWAIADMAALSKEKRQYEQTCYNQYQSFLKMGVEMDVISSLDDFRDYKVIVAPMLYMIKPGVAARLTEWVEAGGQLLATYLCGYVDESTLCYLGGFPGDGLKDLFGLYSEEIDTLYPKDRNGARFTDGETVEICDFAEVLKVKDATVEAVYTDDFYAGTPVVTSRQVKKGAAWYVGARIAQNGMEKLYRRMFAQAGIAVKDLPEGVEYHLRTGEQGEYAFYLNQSEETVTLSGIHGYDLLSEKTYDGNLVLQGYQTALIRR